jgi:dTDP-4-amino-4,6-dideoxygalactose transaminase
MATNLPAVLGGDPVRRPGTFRTTPEVGIEEVLYLGAHVAARDWEPDAQTGGRPLAEGLTLPRNVLEVLGWEQAALAAEFAAVQSPAWPTNVVPLDNGTHAIRLALAALTRVGPVLGLRPPQVGDEVLVPALTWQATAGAALRRNLVPVLVDVLPGTLAMDPEAAEAAVTDRTAAIVAVHPYCRMAALDRLGALASRLGVGLIEDCAHAHGAVWAGRGAGTIGVVGTFSLQGSKSLSTGEGGFALTGDESLADQLCSLVTCGRPVGNSIEMQADNDRMPGVAAALGRAQLLRFPEQHARRVATLGELDRRAADLPGIVPLDAQPEVDVPPGYKWAFRVDLDRFGGMSLDQLRVALEQDLSCEFARIYTPLTDSPYYRPHSDDGLRLSDDFWSRINPARYYSPEAWQAYDSVLAAEHAALLDPGFPDQFATAVTRILANCARIARDVRP